MQGTYSRNSCTHVRDFKSKPTLEGVRVAARLALASTAARPKREKIPALICGPCGAPVPRLHACLHCTFLGCWNSHAHILKHFSDAPKGHFLAMDLTRCQFFCARCKDYVYDPDLEAIVRAERARLADEVLRVTAPDAKRVRYEEWRSSPHDLETLKKDGSLGACAGLKGLFNLGSTCFMNSVLQSLVHNPLMRSYFLSDRHPSHSCQFRNEGASSTNHGTSASNASAAATSNGASNGHNNGNGNGRACLGCEMDALFSRFFSGNSNQPIVPHEFLHSVWTIFTDLAGYEQQDAHEFYMALINGIHLHCKGSASDCQCIAHTTFGGKLRSDITCLNCENVSSSVEPFFDIGVDLVVNMARTGATPTSNPPNTRNFHYSLHECLAQFTQPERLPNVKCSRCDAYRESTKQLSLRALPPTLVVHLKRFEHTSNSATSHKVDEFIQFPLELDVTPYLSAILCDQTLGDEALRIPEVRQGNQYQLFALINHVGTLESGHYIAYILWRNDWYKIDDATVTHASIGDVVSSNAYMLHYVKKTLEYSS